MSVAAVSAQLESSSLKRTVEEDISGVPPHRSRLDIEQSAMPQMPSVHEQSPYMQPPPQMHDDQQHFMPPMQDGAQFMQPPSMHDQSAFYQHPNMVPSQIMPLPVTPQPMPLPVTPQPMQPHLVQPMQQMPAALHQVHDMFSPPHQTSLVSCIMSYWLCAGKRPPSISRVGSQGFWKVM